MFVMFLVFDSQAVVNCVWDKGAWRTQEEKTKCLGTKIFCMAGFDNRRSSAIKVIDRPDPTK
jgi:hypothetical protein